MTLAEIRLFVKRNYRLANTELDTVLDGNINEAWREVSRSHFWPSLLKGASFTTTTAQSYNVAADFDQLVRNSVRYDVTSTSNGWIVPDVSANQIVLYDTYQPNTGPAAVCVRSTGTTTGKELYFSPSLQTIGLTVNYRYRKQVATMSADGDQPEELSCGEAIAWWALQTMAMYHGDDKMLPMFEARYRKALGRALMTAGNFV